MVLEAFQRVWSDFQDLPKSAMFKTMGYSPGLLLEIGLFLPLRIHPKSTQTVAEAVTNYFRMVLEAFQRVWSDFQDLPKSAMFKTMGYSPGLLLEIGRFSTRTNSASIVTNSGASSKQIILEWFWRRFREFRAISRTCQIGHVQNHGL